MNGKFLKWNQGHYVNKEIYYIVIAFLLNLKVNFKTI